MPDPTTIVDSITKYPPMITIPIGIVVLFVVGWLTIKLFKVMMWLSLALIVLGAIGYGIYLVTK
jgi:4-amino-4-deoxy-L-arabinose transferase-like glycosyltransferase